MVDVVRHGRLRIKMVWASGALGVEMIGCFPVEMWRWQG